MPLLSVRAARSAGSKGQKATLESVSYPFPFLFLFIYLGLSGCSLSLSLYRGDEMSLVVVECGVKVSRKCISGEMSLERPLK